MYEVYAIGTCVNCGNLTEDQMRDIVKNSETVSEFTNQLKFVPHTDLITYFKDLWLPLCANWAAIFLSLSILYVVWKVLSTVLLKAYLSVVKNTTPKQKNIKNMRIITDYGEIIISLFGETPDTKKNFETLIDNGFYRDLTFHRVIPGFVAQGGCPNGDGSGGPGHTIKCEVNSDKQYHDRGIFIYGT